MSNVLCRNGPQCRKFQEGDSPIKGFAGYVLTAAGTCSYNHDFSGMGANGLGVLVHHLFERVAYTEHLQSEEESQRGVAFFYTHLHAEERQCSTCETGHFAKGGCGRGFHTKRLRWVDVP